MANGNVTPSTQKYQLTGPHVEPASSYWAYCSKLRMVSIQELESATNNPDLATFFPDYPDDATTAKEFDELIFLAQNRQNPGALVDEASPDRPRRRISRFYDLVPPPYGAAFFYPNPPFIQTGRDLARSVESETPGLFHRQALNSLITRIIPAQSWSPPRQALVWAALDVAIASALQAAWYYKWLNRTDSKGQARRRSRRERPAEYAARTGKERKGGGGFDVLFDLPDDRPVVTRCAQATVEQRPIDCPTTFKGTPRHPAYPSGHSTYAGAASRLLSFFFNQEAAEWTNLADNIGMGRLWAGIHWRSDHVNGLALGASVADLIIQQLADMGIDLCPPKREGCPEEPPPLLKQLETEASEHAEKCRTTKKVPAPCAPELQPELSSNVQQGAR